MKSAAARSASASPLQRISVVTFLASSVLHRLQQSGYSTVSKNNIITYADSGLASDLDLYQAHKDDAETPLEETLGAFDKLVRQGKVRHIGASNYSGPRLAEALHVSKTNGLVSYICLQPHYNLVAREDFETNLLPVVQQHTLGVIPYYSLAGGFLSGKYRSVQDAEGKARGKLVSKYLNVWGWSVLDTLDSIAQEHQSTPARVALAWLMAQPGVTAPIASATSDKHVTDLVEATRLKLDHAALHRLTTVSTPSVASTSTVA